MRATKADSMLARRRPCAAGGPREQSATRRARRAGARGTYLVIQCQGGTVAVNKHLLALAQAILREELCVAGEREPLPSLLWGRADLLEGNYITGTSGPLLGAATGQLAGGPCLEGTSKAVSKVRKISLSVGDDAKGALAA